MGPGHWDWNEHKCLLASHGHWSFITLTCIIHSLPKPWGTGHWQTLSSPGSHVSFNAFDDFTLLRACYILTVNSLTQKTSKPALEDLLWLKGCAGWHHAQPDINCTLAVKVLPWETGTFLVPSLSGVNPFSSIISQMAILPRIFCLLTDPHGEMLST